MLIIQHNVFIVKYFCGELDWLVRPWSEMKWSEVKVTQSCLTLRPHGLYSPWNSPGQNTGMGSFYVLQGIFPMQGSNPGIPHCRWILYQLSHKESPRILKWVDYPFSSRSSQPRNWTRVSCTAGRFFTNWAMVYCYTFNISEKLNLIQVWKIALLISLQNSSLHENVEL